MVAKLQTKLRSIDATEEHDNEDNVSISSSVSQDKYRHCHHQHQQHHHMHSGHETPKVPFIYYVSTIWGFFDPFPTYVNIFYVLKISKKENILTPIPPPFKCLRNI